MVTHRAVNLVSEYISCRKTSCVGLRERWLSGWYGGTVRAPTRRRASWSDHRAGIWAQTPGVTISMPLGRVEAGRIPDALTYPGAQVWAPLCPIGEMGAANCATQRRARLNSGGKTSDEGLAEETKWRPYFPSEVGAFSMWVVRKVLVSHRLGVVSSLSSAAAWRRRASVLRVVVLATIESMDTVKHRLINSCGSTLSRGAWRIAKVL